MKINFSAVDGWFESRGFRFCVSLVLAVALWLYVVGSRNDEVIKTFEYGLTFSNPPYGLMLHSDVKTVSVTLRGERRAINALDESDLSIQLDLRDLEKGLHSLPVTVTPPPRLSVVQITPREIEVDLARNIDKRLNVRVRKPDKLPAGYALEVVDVDPATVIAHGREDELAGVEDVFVTLSPEQAQRSGHLRVPLKAPNGTHYTFTPGTVALELNYFPVTPHKTVPVVVRRRGELEPYLHSLSLIPKPESFVVSGKQERLDQLTELLTEPVDVSQIRKPGTLETKIANLPSDLAITGLPTITVTVDVQTYYVSREIQNVPVEIRGGDDNALWRVDPATISVLVEGPASVVEHLGAEDLGVRAFVNVDGIVAHSMTLPIHLEKRARNDIQSVNAAPGMVTVIRQSE